MVLVTHGSPVGGQEVTEPRLKAAFIYNFAKFTEWPAGALPPGAPISICVVGAPAVAQAIEQTVKGRQHAGHPFVVLRVGAAAPPKTCHVLYASELTPAATAQLLDAVRDAPVLTISDLDGFARSGGMAELYFDRAQLRFAVDVELAGRTGLKISSRLLALSKKKP